MSGRTDEQNGSLLFGDTTFTFQADRNRLYKFRVLNLNRICATPFLVCFERFRFSRGFESVVAANQFELIRVSLAMFDFNAATWALSQLRTLRRPSSKIRS